MKSLIIISNQTLRDFVLPQETNDGNDFVYGPKVTATLSGGLGNDYLQGENGNTTFLFSKGDGRDTIRDFGFRSNDTLKISGYDRDDLIFSRFSPDPDDIDNLLIRFIGTTDEILVLKSLSGGLSHVNQIEFDDGSTLLLTTIGDFLNNIAVAAENDTGYQVAPGAPLAISSSDLIGNDVGVGLKIVDVYAPQNGTLSISDTGVITFTPDEGYIGNASFTYSVKDVNGSVATAEVSTPLAADLPSNFSILGAIDVLGADVAQNVQDFEFMAITNVTGGTAQILPSGEVLFIPDGDFSGTASFEYELTVDGTMLTGSHVFLVGDANVAPRLETEIADFELNEEDAFEYSIPEGTFADSDNQELSYQTRVRCHGRAGIYSGSICGTPDYSPSHGMHVL